MAGLLLVGIVGCSNESKEQEAMPLGIIGAMEEEVEILKEKMEIEETVEIAGMTFYRGMLHNQDVILVRSGVGKVNMAACTQILIDHFNVEALVNSGVSGTLDPELNQGDIVISVEAVQHDFDTTPVGGKPGEISRLGITYFEAAKGLVDVAKEAAYNVENLHIKEGTVAYLNNVPFVIIRSISDKVDGGADLSYEEFLPLAAQNSSALVEEFIKAY